MSLTTAGLSPLVQWSKAFATKCSLSLTTVGLSPLVQLSKAFATKCSLSLTTVGLSPLVQWSKAFATKCSLSLTTAGLSPLVQWSKAFATKCSLSFRLLSCPGTSWMVYDNATYHLLSLTTTCVPILAMACEEVANDLGYAVFFCTGILYHLLLVSHNLAVIYFQPLVVSN